MNNFTNSCRVGFLEYLHQQSDIVSFHSEARNYWDALPYECATGSYRDSLDSEEQQVFDNLSPGEQERIAFDCAKDGFKVAFIEWQNFTYPA